MGDNSIRRKRDTGIVSKRGARWYAGGLAFECQGCGACCSGPGEGYIWVVRREIELIAGFLGLSEGEVRRRFLRRVGLRTSIIEDVESKDCIFLERHFGKAQCRQGQKNRCRIYSVRPGQCRAWPFWPGNLKGPGEWNRAAQKCPGINRGRHYSFEDIERIKSNRKWWADGQQRRDSEAGG